MNYDKNKSLIYYLEKVYKNNDGVLNLIEDDIYFRRKNLKREDRHN